VIALVTFGVMGGLCAKSHLYPDEWLSMFFLTLIFLLVCMFELEYERKQKGISANTQTTFIGIIRLKNKVRRDTPIRYFFSFNACASTAASIVSII